MIKVRLEYEFGEYYATLLSDEEVADNEKCGYRIVSIPESKAVAWGEMQEKVREWHDYWRQLHLKSYSVENNEN